MIDSLDLKTMSLFELDALNQALQAERDLRQNERDAVMASAVGMVQRAVELAAEVGISRDELFSVLGVQRPSPEPAATAHETYGTPTEAENAKQPKLSPDQLKRLGTLREKRIKLMMSGVEMVVAKLGKPNSVLSAALMADEPIEILSDADQAAGDLLAGAEPESIATKSDAAPEATFAGQAHGWPNSAAPDPEIAAATDGDDFDIDFCEVPGVVCEFVAEPAAGEQIGGDLPPCQTGQTCDGGCDNVSCANQSA